MSRPRSRNRISERFRLRARWLAPALLRRHVSRVGSRRLRRGRWVPVRTPHVRESLASYWPNAAEQEQAIARRLNTLPKYVASTTLAEPLAWQNSTLLRGDIVEAVASLKRENGNDLHLIGS